jgi:hypothetical protein
LRRIDAARWRHLNELREAEQRACLIREFIDRLERRVQNENRCQIPAAELQDWFRRARDKAGAGDPLLRSVEAPIMRNLALTDRSYQT